MPAVLNLSAWGRECGTASPEQYTGKAKHTFGYCALNIWSISFSNLVSITFITQKEKLVGMMAPL